MSRAVVLTVLGLSAPLAVAETRPVFRLRLGKDDVGKPPAGWTVAQTHEGQGGAWQVVADPTAPSGSGLTLAQTGAAANLVYNLCVTDATTFGRDTVIRVALKAVKGDVDQGGGVVWLYQDPNNYYVCRYNPLEENLRVYHVKGGKRTQLATKEEVKAADGTWHRLEVTHRGDRITCALDGTHRLEVTDSTLTEPGKVGLWTKADAQTRFDRFEAVSGEK
jgi:hypothetical protein